MWKRLIVCAAMLPALAVQGAQAAPTAAVTLEAFQPDSLERIVANQNGKPFVLIVWSLDCQYCQASMKTLAQEKRKRKDLNVVTLSTDSLADPQAVVLIRKKLLSVGMTNNAWAFGDAPAEQLRHAVDAKWHGELPRSYWFNARGERVAYSGVITGATIEKMTHPKM